MKEKIKTIISFIICGFIICGMCFAPKACEGEEEDPPKVSYPGLDETLIEEEKLREEEHLQDIAEEEYREEMESSQAQDDE